MAVIDLALHDSSADLARRVLRRGVRTLAAVLMAATGDDEFLYVACPDFSITLRQRRLVVGLPIGGYVNWFGKRAFPIDLDVNSCGVHLLQLSRLFSKDDVIQGIFNLKKHLDTGAVTVGTTSLKWNFTRRNHFIALYENDEHTTLFDKADLVKQFQVQTVSVDGRTVPYIAGEDFDEYCALAAEENALFSRRHEEVFSYLFDPGHIVLYADQHFGMVNPGELLMGCSRIRPGTVFPLLTRPFSDIYLAEALPPCDQIGDATGGLALVPHGLGMVVPEYVLDIIEAANDDDSDYVEVTSAAGGSLITNVLEYAGVSYRSQEVLPEMERSGTFRVIEALHPIVCFKL
jgi:hypothetical protein